jgi:hypothetical protein
MRAKSIIDLWEKLDENYWEFVKGKVW